MCDPSKPVAAPGPIPGSAHLSAVNGQEDQGGVGLGWLQRARLAWALS